VFNILFLLDFVPFSIMYSGAWLSFVVGVLILAYKLLSPALRAPLSALPGPLVSRFSRFWLLRAASSGSIHQHAIAIHKKYGKIVRVGPNHVWVNDPQEISHIYGINSTFRKSRFYTMLSSNKDAAHTDLFTCLDPEVHKAKKRNVSNAYAMSSMLTLEPLVDECVDVMFERLESLKDEREAGLDLGKWLQWYAFDVIGAITFSKRFGFMEDGKDIRGMIKGLETSLVYTAVVGQVPELHPYLKANRIWGQYLRRSSSIAIIAPVRLEQMIWPCASISSHVSQLSLSSPKNKSPTTPKSQISPQSTPETSSPASTTFRKNIPSASTTRISSASACPICASSGPPTPFPLFRLSVSFSTPD
jgi:hypothetical protein